MLSSGTCRSRRRPGPRARIAGSPAIPVTGAAQLGLEASWCHGDHRVDVVGDPVRLVVVVELDAGGARKRQRDVRPAGCGMEAVVLIPRVVERSLVLVVPDGQREVALPHIVACVVREVGGRAKLASQSPGQPASDCNDPAMVTLVGFGVCDAVTAPGSTSPVVTSAISTTYTLLSLVIWLLRSDRRTAFWYVMSRPFSDSVGSPNPLFR